MEPQELTLEEKLAKLSSDYEDTKKALVQAVEAKNQLYIAYVSRGHQISELVAQVSRLELTLLAMTNPKGFEELKRKHEEKKPVVPEGDTVIDSSPKS